MRTTVTLNDSVERELRSYAARNSMRFKDAVNDLIVNGLKHAETVMTEQPYRTEPAAMGLQAGLNYDNVSELLEQAERCVGGIR